jgi:hypothetical protein
MDRSRHRWLVCAAVAASALATAPWLWAHSTKELDVFFGRVETCAIEASASDIDLHLLTGRTFGRPAEAFVVVPRCADPGDDRFVIPWERYLRALNTGVRALPSAAPFAASDETGEWRTAVLATALTRQTILEGIRMRRVYASEDRNLKVFFSINGHPLGAVAPLPAGAPLRIEVRLSDEDEPQAKYWIGVHRDVVGGEVEAARELFGTDLRGDGTIVLTQFRRQSNDEYYLLKIMQGGSDTIDVVRTAPIWLVSEEGR